jgi:hypothetical protein
MRAALDVSGSIVASTGATKPKNVVDKALLPGDADSVCVCRGFDHRRRFEAGQCGHGLIDKARRWMELEDRNK